MKKSEYQNKYDIYLRLKNMSDLTINRYKSIIDNFLDAHNIHPTKISTNDIEKYLLNISNARTRNQTIGCLKTFFKEIVGRPNVVNIPYAKVPEKNPIFISKEKFEEGLKKCSNHKHRLIFRLMFNHGLRVGEVVNCKIGWFGSQVVDGIKHYTLNVVGKGAKDRLLCLSTETVSELSNYTKLFGIALSCKNNFLFVGQSGLSYSSTSIQKLTKKYFGVNPHALRHSCATELVNRDVNQKKIQDLLGHSSSKTTEIYSHTSIKSMIGVNA